MNVQDKIKWFAYLMNFAFPEYHGVFSIKEGRKYTKIVHDDSVYAFVDKATGDMYKAASWASPAKGIRNHIDTVLKDISKVSPYGFGYINRW